MTITKRTASPTGGVTRRISGQPGGSITSRVSGVASGGHTSRVAVADYLLLSGDESGKIMLEGDMAGGFLLLEGDAAVDVAEHTRRVPGGATVAKTRRVEVPDYLYTEGGDFLLAEDGSRLEAE